MEKTYNLSSNWTYSCTKKFLHHWQSLFIFLWNIKFNNKHVQGKIKLIYQRLKMSHKIEWTRVDDRFLCQSTVQDLLHGFKAALTFMRRHLCATRRRKALFIVEWVSKQMTPLHNTAPLRKNYTELPFNWIKFTFLWTCDPNRCSLLIFCQWQNRFVCVCWKSHSFCHSLALGFYRKKPAPLCDAPEERFKLFPTQHTMQMQYNHLSFLTAQPENKTLSGRW